MPETTLTLMIINVDIVDILTHSVAKKKRIIRCKHFIKGCLYQNDTLGQNVAVTRTYPKKNIRSL